MPRLSAARPDAVPVDEAQLRKQIARESHRRWILNQRLNVLERTNAELKRAAAQIVAASDPAARAAAAAAAVAEQPRLTARSSSDGAAFDWDVIVSSCMALAQSNAQMRVMVAKIIADKQMIGCRLQHLTRQDVVDIEASARRIADERKLKRGVTNPDAIFQEMLDLSRHQPQCPGWESERTQAADLIALSASLETASITRYVELSEWCEAQRARHGSSSAALGMDQDLDRNMGFSQISDTGFIYAFDEPDCPSNICYQSVDGKENGVVSVRSGTAAKLVEFMTSPSYVVDERLERAFFVTLPSFSDPLDGLELIVQRSNIPSPPNVTPEERRRFRSHVIGPVQQRCLALLRKWIDQFPDDLVGDASVSSLLEQHFQDLMSTDNWFSCELEAKQAHEHFRNVVNSRQMCSGAPVYNKHDQGATSISSFSQIDDNSFVECISYDDCLAFGRIHPREFLNQAWSKPSGHAPNIHQAILRFNCMTSFVQSQILRETSLSKRAAVMARFIHLAEAFRDRKNYNAMCGIFAGLNSNAIHRLKQTWDGLPKKTMNVFKAIKTLVSTNNNSRELRNEMRALKPPCVCHLGLTLKDLTFIDDGNPDRVSHGMINVKKLLMITETIDWVMECQSIPYTMNTELHPGIRDYLEREFVLINDETLWQLSQKIEPRKGS